MHARSTTVRGRPQSIDAGTAVIADEVLPGLQEIEGFVGLSLLTDRETGRCIVTTAWHDENAIAASRSQVTGLRGRAVEALGGTDPEVREWEIATMHREHPVDAGACARVTWLQVPTDRVERQVETYRRTVLPRLQELDGFCSASLLVDRDSGRVAGAAVFVSRDALAATREQTTRIRSEAVKSIGGQILEVAEFEVALAHLRVPEQV